jgi:ketopantoate reductase
VDYKEGGDRAAEDARLKAIVGMLQKGGSECKVVDDIQSERWIKVIWYVVSSCDGTPLTHRNCCWNSLTTVSRQRTSTFFLSSDEALPLCYTIMREVEAVAKAKGLTIPEGTVDRLIKECTVVKAGLPSSMLFDCLAHRAMEVEVILGTPLKEGKRLGVPVPTLTA